MSATSVSTQSLNATAAMDASSTLECISDEDASTFAEVCKRFRVDSRTTDKCVTYLTTRDTNVWTSVKNDPTHQPTATTDHTSPTKAEGPPFKVARIDVADAPPLQPSQDQNKVLEPLEAIKMLMIDVITEEHWAICGFYVGYKRGKKRAMVGKDEEESKDSFLTRLLDEIQDTDTLMSCTLSVRVKKGVTNELSLDFMDFSYTFNMLQTQYDVKFLDAIDVDQLTKGIKRTSNEENEFLEGLVPTTPSIDNSFFDTNAMDSNKSRVLVVAGESGSGKTAFARQGLHKLFNKIVLYRTVSSSDVRCLIVNDYKIPANARAFKLMVECIDAAASIHSTQSTQWVADLYDAYSLMRRQRKSSARSLLQNMLNPEYGYGYNDSPNYIRWWSATSDNPTDATLDELVIVLDEVGGDLHLASGLVDVAREVLQDLILGPQKAKRCTLVLCGTGLDALRHNTDTGSPSSMTVTNPDKSLVVMMQKPQLDKLVPELSEPIQNGIYSSILATNARMLMDGVVPLLESTFVSLQLKGDELKQNRQKVGNYRGMMSYPLRLYPNLNALSNLITAKMKEKIAEAFKYLWSANLIEGKDYGLPDPKWQIPAMDSNIFQYGIATMNPSETSEALCFVASTGLTVPVLPKGGLAFNDMIALHMARLWQVFGFHVCEMELEEAWPPTLHNSKKKSKERREEAEDNIELLQSVNMKKAIEHLGRNKQSVVILRNAALDSQGPDIFMAERNGKSHTLYVIKCKNMVGLPGSTLVDQGLLHSLGISGRDEHDGRMSTANDNTTIKNAEEILDIAYCGAAIQKLVDCLKQEGQEEWFIKRILAEPHRTLQTIESVYHWTGEFFEPTLKATTKPVDTARR